MRMLPSPRPTAPPGNGSADAVMVLTGVGKRFGAVPVLDDVDLSVAPGEIVALVGENGAGKTTVVRCIAGVLTPDAGTIRFGAGRARGGPPAAGRVAVVWQDL